MPDEEPPPATPQDEAQIEADAVAEQQTPIPTEPAPPPTIVGPGEPEPMTPAGADGTMPPSPGGTALDSDAPDVAPVVVTITAADVIPDAGDPIKLPE